MVSCAVLFRKAFGRLLAAPLFTAFAVLSLAAGVAVTTAVYSVVDKLFLSEIGATVARIAGVRHDRLERPPHRAERVGRRTSRRCTIVATVVFADHRIVTVLSFRSTSNADAEVVDRRGRCALVLSARWASAASDRHGCSSPRTMPSEAAGRRVERRVLAHVATPADAGVLGRTVRDRRASVRDRSASRRTAIRGHRRSAPFTTMVWIPLASEALIHSDAPIRTGRDPICAHGAARSARRGFWCSARLRPGGSIASASAELQTIVAISSMQSRPRAAAVRAAAPTARPHLVERHERLVITTTKNDDSVRRIGFILIGLVAMVLVVACTNLANLVLARGTARQGELAIRMAMGASRGAV